MASKNYFLSMKELFNFIKHRCFYRRTKPISAFQHKDIKAKLIFPSEEFEMPLIKDIYGNIHKHFLPYKTKIPATYVFTIKNGKCIFGKEEVFTKNNEIVSEISSQKGIYTSTFLLKRITNAKKIKGFVVNLSLSGLENNYYHFWIEWYARYYLLQQSGLADDETQYIITQETAFQKQLVQLLQINKSKILHIEKGKMIQADNLIVPSLINNWEYLNFTESFKSFQKQWLPSWLPKAYQLFSNNDKTPDKNIFISRKAATYRQILNEDEIFNEIKKYGFNKYCLEDMPLMDQISLFNSAKNVISPHGAGLTNLVFSPQRVNILEIFTKNYHDSGFKILIKVLGHNYHYIVAAEEEEKTMDLQKENAIINLKDIEHYLSNILRMPKQLE